MKKSTSNPVIPLQKYCNSFDRKQRTDMLNRYRQLEPEVGEAALRISFFTGVAYDEFIATHNRLPSTAVDFGFLEARIERMDKSYLEMKRIKFNLAKPDKKESEGKKVGENQDSLRRLSDRK